MKLPVFIRPSSVEIGDLVAVTKETGKIKHTVQGRVTKRDYEGGFRVLYVSDGQELFRWHPAHDTGMKITLLDRMPAHQEMLDFDSIAKVG